MKTDIEIARSVKMRRITEIADKIGILNSYWMTIALLAYVLFYALAGSRLGQKKA